MEEQEFIGGDVNCGGRREPADISRCFWKKQKKERGTSVSKTGVLNSSPSFFQPWCRQFLTCRIINMVLRAGTEPAYHQIINGALRGDL